MQKGFPEQIYRRQTGTRQPVPSDLPGAVSIHLTGPSIPLLCPGQACPVFLRFVGLLETFHLIEHLTQTPPSHHIQTVLIGPRAQSTRARPRRCHSRTEETRGSVLAQHTDLSPSASPLHFNTPDQRWWPCGRLSPHIMTLAKGGADPTTLSQ